MKFRSGTALAALLAVLALGAAPLGVPAASAQTATPLAVIVHADQSCLSQLSAGDQAVLNLRFGTGGTGASPAPPPPRRRTSR